MDATLIRHPQQSGPTLGTLVLDNGWTCQTLELPWRDNQHDVSCIPDFDSNAFNEARELYTVIPHRSATKGDCFAVLDVPNRTSILIHADNTAKDTQGCILVGLERGPDNASIQHSQAALQELRRQAPDGFQLSIIYA